MIPTELVLTLLVVISPPAWFLRCVVAVARGARAWWKRWRYSAPVVIELHVCSMNLPSTGHRTHRCDTTEGEPE
ncbi:hypothetical protein CFN78_23765 [Amycolatopsis antarctica]|uniref:Uncharacterized protein n=1 Tax=Amycolatopsis antarctica TaxID=1854586 RepID=A0A263CX19_9PSEU|nr:hypothetical protein [Amycolatopsis antarctica]OZM70694.1 hypothetical protein CFN78_23765 [Amycolatopsis antarctica]